MADQGRNATPASPIRLWFQLKYIATTTPIPIATGDEAQLIIAEGQLAAGNLTGAISIINAFHTRAGLPQFSSTDPAATLQQLIRERRAELFLESHNLGDLRRYGLPLSPAAGSPYPFGGNYGTQTCFPLPDDERLNNPNIG